MVRRVLHVIREIALSEGAVVIAEEDPSDVEMLGCETSKSSPVLTAFGHTIARTT
jgi:hypothetical protein